MNLLWKNQSLRFEPVGLRFEPGQFENVFAHKNNKTVAETLVHHRYRRLVDEVKQVYGQYLDWKLGEFLLHLKAQKDDFYLRFLNKYGDQKYSRFYIEDESYWPKKGLYSYAVKGELRYIGRCRDSFKKRINQGYGKIHPKNCYLDGQATNCHLNALLTDQADRVTFWTYPLEDNRLIETVERELIGHYNPLWNIALRLG